MQKNIITASNNSHFQNRASNNSLQNLSFPLIFIVVGLFAGVVLIKLSKIESKDDVTHAQSNIFVLVSNAPVPIVGLTCLVLLMTSCAPAIPVDTSFCHCL